LHFANKPRFSAVENPHASDCPRISAVRGKSHCSDSDFNNQIKRQTPNMNYLNSSSDWDLHTSNHIWCYM